MGIASFSGASSVIKPGVVTSSTRPSAPFVGQLIYETDTANLEAYNGSAWVTQNALQLVGSTTAAAASTISIDNVFSATYQNYLVQVSNFTASVEDYWCMRLRASGSNITASNYTQTSLMTQSNTDTFYHRRAVNIAYWYGDLVSTSDPTNIQFFISQPFAVAKTRGNIHCAGSTNADFRQVIAAHSYNATTSVDGIQLFPNTSGTLSATIRVYGISNS